MESGESTSATADREGVTAHWVRQVGGEAGLGVFRAAPAEPSPRAARVIAALVGGESASTVARREGVGLSRIYKIAKKAGVPLQRSRPGPPPAVDEVIVSQTALRIGRRFGVWRAVTNDLDWTEAGEVVGLSRGKAIQLERGTLDVGLSVLERVATVMDLTVDQLVA